MNATRFNLFPFQTASLVFLCIFGLTSCFSSKSARSTKGVGKEELRLRQNITAYAERYVGTPYRYGGQTPNKGFDCSGFTSFVMQEYGVALERTSKAQGRMGKKIPLSQSKAGDLVFFHRNGKVFHVSLVVANTRAGIEVVHATSSRGVIRENITNSSYWWPKKKFVRDVLGDF